MEREKQENGHYRLLPDIKKGETSLGMLRVIGLAAFEKAGISFQSESEMKGLVRDIDGSIHERTDGLSLAMGFKKGLQIKTDIFPGPNNVLILNSHQYMKDHDGASPDSLLDRADAILKEYPNLNTMVIEQQPSAAPMVLPKKGGVLGKLGTIFNKSRR